MNALSLIPEHARSDPFWVGSLSMAIACAVRETDHKHAQRNLKRTLDDFLHSPLPSEELRGMLQEELKK